MSANVCQICGSGIDEAAAVLCPEPGCRSPYHPECWQWLGGCARYGCPRMVEVSKAPEERPTYWGASEKQCPICANHIPIDALWCPVCRTRFQETRPLTRDDLFGRPPDPIVVRTKRAAIWILALSILGFLSPIVLLAAALWYRRNRTELERAGPAAKAMALIGMGVSAAWVVLIRLGLVVFALAGQR